MATNTPRINLVKPDGTDLVDIAVINSNYDKIDANIASTKIQATKPATANAGDLWWDSNTGTLYLYYTDANSSQWVAATSDPVNIGVVANQSERDAQYPTPGQGMRVYRTDLGVTQTYYGLFNVSTNPGGRDVAGWYNTEKNVGLVPIQPTSVVIATGSGSANALGQISFTGATAINLNGIFSSEYRKYSILLDYAGTANHALQYRFRANGTDSVTGYFSAGIISTVGASVGNYNVNGGTSGDTGIGFSSTRIYQQVKFELSNPFLVNNTVGLTDMVGINSINTATVRTGFIHEVNASYDGFTIYPNSGNITGTVQVFGYND